MRAIEAWASCLLHLEPAVTDGPVGLVLRVEHHDMSAARADAAAEGFLAVALGTSGALAVLLAVVAWWAWLRWPGLVPDSLSG